MLKDPNAFAREEKRHSNYLNRKKKIDDPLMDRIYKEGMDRKVRLEQVKLQNENNKIEESRINANKAFLDRPQRHVRTLKEFYADQTEYEVKKYESRKVAIVHEKKVE